MGDSEEQGVSGSCTGMQLQGGSSSSPPRGGGVVVGGEAMGVNKETTLPMLMALKGSLEAQLKAVNSLINMVSGEEIVAEEGDQIAYQLEIQRKALEDERDRSLELQMQIEIMNLTLSSGLSSGTSSS